MRRHTALDALVASVGSVYGETLKFFSEGVQSPPLATLVKGMVPSVPPPTGTGEYTATISANGETIETRYTVERWEGAAAPTLIFHHGSGDIPYRRRLERILRAAGPRRDALPGTNVIATSSPYNETRREYFAAIRDLERFATLLAGSAVLIEGLRQVLPQSSPFIVSGISLGGWITNLHHACFDTATEYRPIFAGAALDALFTDSSYTALTSKKALADPGVLKQCLNFEEDFGRRPNEKVFPLLARYDQYITLERQGGIYGRENVTIIDKGHITGTADNEALLSALQAGFAVKSGA
jgi:hypothetical protein